MTDKEIERITREILSKKNAKEVLEIMPHETFYSYMKKCNEMHPYYIATDYFGQKLTYEQLDEKISTCANNLLHVGVRPGDFVVTTPLNTPEGIISIYAINKIGAVVHMLNPQMSLEEIKKHIMETKSKVAFTYDVFYSEKMMDAFASAGIKNTIIMHLNDSLPLGLNKDKIKMFLATYLKGEYNDPDAIPFNQFMKPREIVSLDCNNILYYSREYYTHPYEDDKIATIAYTSGSTGESKAVASTNLAINAVTLTNVASVHAIKEQDGVYSTLPYWINYSFANSLHEALCLGCMLELDPLFDPKRMKYRFTKYNICHWNTVPYYVEQAFNSKGIAKANMSSIKTLFTGGDFLKPSQKEKADAIISSCGGKAHVGQGYGLSETLCGIAMNDGSIKGDNSSGKILAGVHIKIYNPETGQEISPYEEGEIYLSSPTLFKEYYGNAQATKECIFTDIEGIRWFKTGDIGRIIPETGNLEITGRIRRIVMTLDATGLPTKIIPEKIKVAICQNPMVANAEVIIVEDKERINVPVLFVVFKDEDIPCDAEEQLMNYLRQKVPAYMVPKNIFSVDKIPLKPSLKPEFNRLREMYNELSVGKTNPILIRRYQN